MVNDVKQNVPNTVFERLSTTGFVAYYFVKVRSVKYFQRLFVVGLVDTFKVGQVVDIPNTKRRLLLVNPVVPNVMGVQNVAKKLHRSFSDLILTVNKNISPFLIEVMTVFKQFSK